MCIFSQLMVFVFQLVRMHGSGESSRRPVAGLPCIQITVDLCSGQFGKYLYSF